MRASYAATMATIEGDSRCGQTTAIGGGAVNVPRDSSEAPSRGTVPGSEHLMGRWSPSMVRRTSRATRGLGEVGPALAPNLELGAGAELRGGPGTRPPRARHATSAAPMIVQIRTLTARRGPKFWLVELRAGRKGTPPWSVS